jgi:hypothetical protein
LPLPKRSLSAATLSLSTTYRCLNINAYDFPKTGSRCGLRLEFDKTDMLECKLLRNKETVFLWALTLVVDKRA